MTPAFAASRVTAGEYVPTADQRLVMYGVPWARYLAQLSVRGDAPVPRVAYLEGALELMSPSRDHERIKSYLGCLLEAYALETGIDLSPYGAWTLKHAPRKAGAEPDECYIVGSDQDKDVPDLVIEVAWTRGGLDKLEIYRRLGIREVWLWRAEQVEVHALRGHGYERVSRSPLFPQLDIELLVSFLGRPTALQAVKAFRQALGRRSSAGRPRPRRRRTAR